MGESDPPEEALLTRQEACASLGITPARFELLRQQYRVEPEVKRSLMRTTVNLYRRADIERLRGKDLKDLKREGGEGEGHHP